MKDREEYISILEQDNAELKKQLEERSKDYCNASNIKHNYAKKLVIIQNQQQLFIKYLEDEIKELQKIKETELDYDILKDVTTQLLDYKEILQKYKETIGVSNDY